MNGKPSAPSFVNHARLDELAQEFDLELVVLFGSYATRCLYDDQYYRELRRAQLRRRLA